MLKAGIKQSENNPYKMFIWVKTQTILFRYYTTKTTHVIGVCNKVLLARLLFPRLHEVQRAIEVTSVVPVLVPVTFAVKSSRSPYIDNQISFIVGP